MESIKGFCKLFRVLRSNAFMVSFVRGLFVLVEIVVKQTGVWFE